MKSRIRIWIGMMMALMSTPALGSARAAHAQMHVDRIDGPIRMDGHVDEPAWERIRPLPMTMYRPVYGGAIEESTEIRLAYDDRYIYVSAKLFTRDAGDMRVNSLQRDVWRGDDTVGVILDTFNDNENAVWLFTNPYGVRFDTAISNDAEEPSPLNPEWDAHWDAATTITDQGWFAEMRIPFASLAFQDQVGKTTMGIIAYRYMGATTARYTYPDIPPSWTRGSHKPSLAQDVVFEGVHRERPVYVTPYVLGGVVQAAALDPATGAHEPATDYRKDLGLDIKYSFTNNATLDVTINTDFAQVEADEEQSNLTRFSLFFPEKRRFFQERAGIFDFRMSDTSRLFHSRRIGLDDHGEPVRIYGGMRLVGRLGAWDLGVLDMHTAASGDTPSENLAVLRLRRKVLNDWSTVGALLTSRVSHENYNVVYGLDSILRIAGDDYFVAKWAQSVDGADATAWSPERSGRLHLAWERRKEDGFTYHLLVSRSGRSFDPGIGFERRHDFLQLGATTRMQWLFASGWLRRVWIGNELSVFHRNQDLAIVSLLESPFAYAEARNGALLGLATSHSYERIVEPFSLFGRVEIPVGAYGFHEALLKAATPDVWLLRALATLSYGSFYNGSKASLLAETVWNLSKHLEMSSGLELNRLDFPAQGHTLDALLARMRISAAINTKLSFGVLLQYNNMTGTAGANVRLRMNFREGNDLWLVYNQRMSPEGRAPEAEQRALLLKYTQTFVPRAPAPPGRDAR